MLGPSPFFPASGGSGGASSGSPAGFVGRDIVWVDLRFWPGVGDGTEELPFNTANLGLGALPNGGTLVMAGGDATTEAGVNIGARSGSFLGFSGQKASGGLTPVLPTLTYAITTGTQRLAFRNISVALVHSGTAASLSEFYFEFCPTVTLTAGGDASPVFWVGAPGNTVSGSGGAAIFVGGTIAGYVANSGTVVASGSHITSDITSPTSVTIVGACTFGGAISITAPAIYIEQASYNRAVAAGVSFSSAVIPLFVSGAPSDVGTANAEGTSPAVARRDHVHNTPFSAVAAALALANAAVNFNGQRLTGLGAPINPNDAARLVDLTAAAAGLKVKHSALVVATSNQATRSGTAQTIDGVLLSTIGTYVLLIAQTTASQNGLWLVQSGAWIRPVDGVTPANDFSTGSSAAQSYVLITSGTLAGNSYFCTNAVGSDVVDTANLNWTIFNQPPVIIDGAGLVKTGSTFDVVAGDATIVVNPNELHVGVIGNANLANNTIAPARLTNAGAQGDFLMRVSSGAGAWEDGTAAQARSALGLFGYGALIPVRAATTANITLSGAQTIDGVSCIAGDRVLVKNQTTGSQNGVYVVAAGAWARATDADGAGELVGGMLFEISEGTANGNRVAMLTTDDPITIGSTTLTFAMDRVVPVTSTAPVDVTKSAAAIGTSTEAARQDHKHDISTAAVTDIGTSNTEGVATSLARSDHGHRLAVTTLVAILATTAASVSVNSQKITNLLTPTVSTDAATMGYVDGISYLTAGAGLTKTGSTIDVVAGDATIVVSANDIKVGVIQTANIANDAVTYAKLQNVSATSRLLGRITAGAGDAEELTGTQTTTLLDTFTSSLKGLMTASGGGTANFARADGGWAAPPGVPGGSTTQIQYNNGGSFAGMGWTTNGNEVVPLQANGAPSLWNLGTKSFTGLTSSVTCRIWSHTITGTYSYVAGAYSGSQALFERFRQPTIAGDSATAAFTGVQAITSYQGPPVQGTNATLSNAVCTWYEVLSGAIAIGPTPASQGAVRTTNGFTLWSTNASASDRRLIEQAGEDQSFGALAGTGTRYWDAGDGGTHNFRDGNGGARVLAAISHSNGLNMLSHIVQGVTSLAFSGTVSGIGDIKQSKDASAYSRNGTTGGPGAAANTRDLPIYRNVSDALILGGGTEGWVGVNVEATSGPIDLKIATASYLKVQTTGTTIRVSDGFGGFSSFSFQLLEFAVGQNAISLDPKNSTGQIRWTNATGAPSAGANNALLLFSHGTSGTYLMGARDHTDIFGTEKTLLTWGVGANERLGIGTGAGSIQLGNAATAFFGGTPATKQTITGSRGGNAALQNLLTALQTYGLITDSSS